MPLFPFLILTVLSDDSLVHTHRAHKVTSGPELPPPVFLAHIADSGGTWTGIPVETGHPFRRKLDTFSGAKWTPFPVETGHFLMGNRKKV